MTNLHCFGIDPRDFARNAKKWFACSATTQPSGAAGASANEKGNKGGKGGSKGKQKNQQHGDEQSQQKEGPLEVLIQGSVVAETAKHIIEHYKLPQKLVEAAAAPGGKKSKKKKGGGR